MASIQFSYRVVSHVEFLSWVLKESGRYSVLQRRGKIEERLKKRLEKRDRYSASTFWFPFCIPSFNIPLRCNTQLVCQGKARTYDCFIISLAYVVGRGFILRFEKTVDEADDV